MNLVDCVVTRVLGTPVHHDCDGDLFGYWTVKVEYDSWGTVSETNLVLRSEHEANGVREGHKFLA